MFNWPYIALTRLSFGFVFCAVDVSEKMQLSHMLIFPILPSRKKVLIQLGIRNIPAIAETGMRDSDSAGPRGGSCICRTVASRNNLGESSPLKAARSCAQPSKREEKIIRPDSRQIRIKKCIEIFLYWGISCGLICGRTVACFDRMWTRRH